MSNLQPGTYKAKPENVQFGIVETTGNEYIRVSFSIDFDDGSVETIGADLYFTEKTYARSIESLRYCGWTGTDLAALDNGVDGMGSAIVELVLAMDKFTDDKGVEKETLKVQWVNRPGGRAVAKPMSDQQKAAFAARMKGALMVGAPKAGAARPATSNARPPARPAPVPNRNGAPAWDGTGPDPSAGDDIPFLPTAGAASFGSLLSLAARWAVREQ